MITGGDKELHWVTRGYRGLQGFKRIKTGYRALQGVTEYDEGLPRVTEGDKG